MKVTFIKARGTFKPGDATEIEAKDFDALNSAGFVVTASEYASITARKKEGEDAIVRAVDTLKGSEAIPTKDTEVLAASLKAFEEGTPAHLVVRLLNAEHKPKVEARAAHTGRLTDGQDPDAAILGYGKITASLQDACENGYVKAREPMDKMIREGKLKEAIILARDTGRVLSGAIMPIWAKGGNFSFKEVIKAADNVDPAVQTLATGMVMLTRTFGFLKNKLNFLDKITTDLRAEAIMFGQNVMTRYITPPAVLTFVPGIGLTSDIDTINNWKNTITAANPAGTVQVLGATNTTSAGGGTQYSGTQFVVTAASVAKQTRSSPSSTDVSVVLNQYRGVSVEFNNLQHASTMRNLPGEQYDAQLYSLTEQINKDLLTTLFGATWTGVSAGALSLNGGSANLSTFGLKDIIRIKNKFSLNKLPDVGRFALMHSSYHDGILTDSNLLTAKAILSLIKKDTGSFEDGELPVLFGVKVLESQLAAYKAAALVSITDPTTIPTTADTVGFAGNSASALFVARIPQDYNKVLGDVPATASLEIVTEPDSGLSMLVKKRVDNNLEKTIVDCGLMYNFAQGDPRQGFLLNP